MKVKNISARLHHVGDVSIAPGVEASIDDCYANALSSDLQVLQGPSEAHSDPVLPATEPPVVVAPVAPVKGAGKAGKTVVTEPVAPVEPDLSVVAPVWAPPAA